MAAAKWAELRVGLRPASPIDTAFFGLLWMVSFVGPIAAWFTLFD